MSEWQHVSLFAGVGGGDLGFHAAGIPTVAAVEIDAQARGVIAHRFPHAALHTDVRKVQPDDLRDAGAVPERTILTAGFPCQPFSVAGRRQGVDDEAGRGELFWEIDRILAGFPAAWIILENVPGLLSIDGGRTMGTILRDLGERGYGWAFRVLDAQHFGVPQRRRRVFIVGHLGDDRGPVQVLLEPEGGGGDPASGVTPGPVAAGRAAAGAGGTVAATLNSGGTNGGFRSEPGEHLVPYVKTIRSGARDEDGNLPPEVWDRQCVSPTLNVFDNNGETRATVLAVTPIDVRNVSRKHDSTGVGTPGTGVGDEGDPAYSLSAQGATQAVAVMGDIAHALMSEGADASEDGTGRGTPIVAFSMVPEGGQGAAEITTAPALNATAESAKTDRGVLAPTLSATNNPSRSPQSAEVTAAQVEAVIAATSTVRRLTPVECERLMGWPDGHTAHRIDFRTGKVVAQADSSRYRQCGNGMAAPVVEWIARRILAVEDGAA